MDCWGVLLWTAGGPRKGGHFWGGNVPMVVYGGCCKAATDTVLESGVCLWWYVWWVLWGGVGPALRNLNPKMSPPIASECMCAVPSC